MIVWKNQWWVKGYGLRFKFAFLCSGTGWRYTYITCVRVYTLLCFALAKDWLALHLDDFCYIFLYPERLGSVYEFVRTLCFETRGTGWRYIFPDMFLYICFINLLCFAWGQGLAGVTYQ